MKKKIVCTCVSSTKLDFSVDYSIVDWQKTAAHTAHTAGTQRSHSRQHKMSSSSEGTQGGNGRLRRDIEGVCRFLP